MGMALQTLAVSPNSGSRLGLAAPAASGPRRFVLCGLALVLVVLCLITPPFQIPDEHRHFFRAYQLSEGVLFPYRIRSDMEEGTTVQALHTTIGGSLPRAVDVLLLSTHAD